MKLDRWLSVLRAASRELDKDVLSSHTARIIQRASSLAMGSTTFYASRTATGIRFVAAPPSERARRALTRAIADEMPAIRAELAEQARERLRG